MREALDAIRREVSESIESGARIVILSDRNSDEVFAPIPSLLLTSAVHHHLIARSCARRWVSSSSVVTRAKCTTWRS